MIFKIWKEIWWRLNISPLSAPRDWIFLPEEKNLKELISKEKPQRPLHTQWNPIRLEGKWIWIRGGQRRRMRLEGKIWSCNAANWRKASGTHKKENLSLLSLPISAVCHEFLFPTKKCYQGCKLQIIMD